MQTGIETTTREIENFVYAGSDGDELDINISNSTWAKNNVYATSYRLRKATGKNIRIWRDWHRKPYDYNNYTPFTVYIEPISYASIIEQNKCDITDIEPTQEENTMTKVSDKLTKVNESFTINMYDNGYMVEVGGRDSEDEWKTSKIICSTLDEVIEIVRETANMTRQD